MERRDRFIDFMFFILSLKAITSATNHNLQKETTNREFQKTHSGILKKGYFRDGFFITSTMDPKRKYFEITPT